MAARRYSEFKERRVSSKGKGASTGGRGVRPPTLPHESTAKWPEMRKERQADRGLGWPGIKTFVAGGYMPKGSSHFGTMPMKKKVAAAMHEVFTDEPRTVTRANVSEARKRRMKQAIAFSKARRGEK